MRKRMLDFGWKSKLLLVKIKKTLCVENLSRQLDSLRRVCRFYFIRQEENHQRWSDSVRATVVRELTLGLESHFSILLLSESILSILQCMEINMSWELMECHFHTCMPWTGRKEHLDRTLPHMELKVNMMMGTKITSLILKLSLSRIMIGINRPKPSQ